MVDLEKFRYGGTNYFAKAVCELGLCKPLDTKLKFDHCKQMKVGIHNTFVQYFCNDKDISSMSLMILLVKLNV